MTAKAAKSAKTTANDTPKQPLSEFIANVNKKDKLNGFKITFGFTKRKRK
jgi:hypothetical protein